jgi:hypothetical protein
VAFLELCRLDVFRWSRPCEKGADCIGSACGSAVSLALVENPSRRHCLRVLRPRWGLLSGAFLTERSLRPYRLHQPVDADNRDHPLHVVGEHVERHFGGNLRQRHREEMRPAHPALDCAERMLRRRTTNAHGVGIFVEPRLYRFEHSLVLPTPDPPLFPRRALGLERAFAAYARPVAARLLAVLLAGVAIGQPLAGRAAVDVIGRIINKVRLAEAALGLGATAWAA